MTSASPATWRRYLPTWIGSYERTWLRGDLLAGITVTAYLIPQVMAYAEVAGMPPVTGLWAIIGALTAYAIVGSSRTLSVGPESTTALMTAAAVGAAVSSPEQYPSFVVALSFVVGGICLIGRVAGLSRLSELLSKPVLVGYMAGIAGVMITSQLGKLTGAHVEGDGFFPRVAWLATHLQQVHIPTLVLGLTTATLMLVGRRFWPRAPIALLGMLAASAVVTWTPLRDTGVHVIGTIPAGLPAPTVPHLTLEGVGALLLPACGVAFVGYSDNILTARAFAQPGERVDARRELLALGVANIGSGLMQGFPVSSSGSRTAIASAVGARSQLAAVSTVVATILALFTLRPVLAAFPTAALGAVVLYAALRLVDVKELRRFAHFRRSEFIIALTTALTVLVVDVLQGIIVAIALSIVDLLRRVTRPRDAVQGFVPGMAGMHDVADWPGATTVPGLVVYRYDSPLFFANAEHFRGRAMAAVQRADEPVKWFVLNAEAISEVDITAIDSLEQLRADLSAMGVVFAMARVKQDPLWDDLERAGFLDAVGEHRVYATLPTAVAAYRDATGTPEEG